MKKFLLWMEWILLFVAAPIAIGFGLRQMPWLLLLFGIAVAAGLWLSQRGGFRLKHFWHGEDLTNEKQHLKQILWRFTGCALALVALVLAFFPHKLFVFPRTMPLYWAALLLAYPLLSVYPQELLYRAFFVRRYRHLFPRKEFLLLASALVFAWMHLIFRNPLAVGLTLVGGLFFTHTYIRTRSLRLVCLEHSLYGNLIFTIGLGEFFTQGMLVQ
jgi:membrane protease YdiL (CAAX protease family)